MDTNAASFAARLRRHSRLGPDPPHGGAAAGGRRYQSGDKPFVQAHNCLFSKRENSDLRRHIPFENTTRCGFATLSGGVCLLELRFAQDSNMCRKDVTDGGGPLC